MSNTTNSELDWDQYFLMNTVHLLRSLKVMDNLTPFQKQLIEAHCKLRGATVREALALQDIDSRIDEVRNINSVVNEEFQIASKHKIYKYIGNRITALTAKKAEMEK